MDRVEGMLRVMRRFHEEIPPRAESVEWKVAVFRRFNECERWGLENHRRSFEARDGVEQRLCVVMM